MVKLLLTYLDRIIYWLIIIIPFFIAIAPAPVNIFMGFLIAGFLVTRYLRKERLFGKTAINLSLLLFFLVTILSIFNSVSLKDSFKGGALRLLQYIFILFALAESVRDGKHLKRIIFSITAGLILASLDSVWQVITGHDFIRGYAPVVNIGLVRATASFKDSNNLGIYLSAFAPLIFGLTGYYFKHKEKILFIFVSVLTLTGIILTYSRPTLLAIYAALFFLGIARRDKMLVSLLIIFMLIAPFIAPKSVKDWAKQVDYNPVRFMCNDDRIAIYRNSLNMIRQHPVIGVGANTFMKNYKTYKESPEYRNVITSDTVYAHNNFLHMAGELGLIGLGVFIWLLYKLFVESKNIYYLLKDEYLKVIALSLIACLISFLVNGLAESSLFHSRVAIVFWYICGLILSLRKFAIAKEQATV
ncbi:MAG: O-antigen ligase family protein [Candidatus Omnitrophica bacterium]|nr:O-antigen ligase family protein [Candidatus Omnitrophota bacterium]MDD5238159.1 O-antigen ligase family protein [Candidatus Omnitrophota bacterium]